MKHPIMKLQKEKFMLGCFDLVFKILLTLIQIFWEPFTALGGVGFVYV